LNHVRRRRRIRNLANLGALPFLFAIALLESNDARKVAVAFALVYAVAITLWIFRDSRCPRCRSLRSTRDIKFGQTTITVPWFFSPSCQRCGWVEGDNVEEES
jgi:hypothetical protein